MRIGHAHEAGDDRVDVPGTELGRSASLRPKVSLRWTASKYPDERPGRHASPRIEQHWGVGDPVRRAQRGRGSIRPAS